MVEEDRVFDQMKESSQTLEGAGMDHDDRPPGDGSRCPFALLSLLDTEWSMKSGCFLSIGKSKGRIFGQLLLEVVLYPFY